MSSLVARSMPPLIIPVSATLKYGKRNFSPTELLELTRALESMHLTKHSIGVSTKELLITSHIGDENTRQTLTKLGFDVTPKRRVMYQLVRRADATRLLPESLADILGSIQAMRHLVETNFRSDSDISTELLLGHFVSMASCWYMPGNGRQLSLVLSDAIQADDQRPSLDALVIHALRHKVDQNDPLTSFRRALAVELTAWKDAVDHLFDNSAWNITEEFQNWIGSYLEYMTQQYKETMIEAEPVMESTMTSASAAGVSSAAEQIEILREELPGVAAVREPVTHQPHGREQIRPPLIESDNGGIQVRYKGSRSFMAWQIPRPSHNPTEQFIVPQWALFDLIEACKKEQRGLTDFAGCWMVRTAIGAQIFTPEQFAFEFDRA